MKCLIFLNKLRIISKLYYLHVHLQMFKQKQMKSDPQTTALIKTLKT